MNNSTLFRRTANRTRGWKVFLAVVGFIVVFELIRIVLPFNAINPLWQQVTTGQPVIDNWNYGGLDEEGYLKFSNPTTSTLLPPGTRLFDANGKFVVIEAYTSGTLTFAQPWDAIPLRWVEVGASGLVIGSLFMIFSWRRRRAHRPFRSATARTVSGTGRGISLPRQRSTRSTRFKPRGR